MFCKSDRPWFQYFFFIAGTWFTYKYIVQINWSLAFVFVVLFKIWYYFMFSANTDLPLNQIYMGYLNFSVQI